MARAKRICPKPGCPHAAVKRYCPEHEREYEQQRGNSNQRGYGYQHKQLREQWRAKVEAGTVDCARCHQPIHKGQTWDLGHDDDDRSKYVGPEHANQCNRASAGRRSHR